jgi:hypothetical protein
VHLFSAPIGTAASGYAEFGETLAALLPPPNHRPHPDLGIGPGDPHSPPLRPGVAKRCQQPWVYRQISLQCG